LCPIFNFKNVEKSISELPDKIDLENSDSWIIKYDEDLDGQLIEQKPICIVPKKFEQYSDYGLRISFDEKEEETIRKRYIPQVRFEDIGGIDDIIEIIREVIELPLNQPELFDYLGVKPHKGILLFGPPGCGKTLIAKAIANEIKAHFISIKGPELFNKYHGQSEQNLRDVFEEGRYFQPSIIFFDEIDSIAQKRSGEEYLRFDSRFVNQLLTLMDGIEEYGNVCIIASTNRPELLDEAIIRPGRFDYSIEIKKPTLQGCIKIFKIHTDNMPVSSDFDIESFSERLEGLSGADIAFIAREGAYNCLRRSINVRALIKTPNTEVDFNKLIIEEIDFLQALKKVI